MKQAIVWKVSTLLLIFVISLIVYPLQSTADGNVFDCIENDKDCEEGITPVIEDNVDETKPAVALSVWEYIKVVFALVFVVGLLFFLLKFINRKNRMYDKTRLMKNMGGISLGQHKSVQLVVIAESYYLIGVGEDIRLLKEITDPAEIERLMAFYEEAESGPKTGWLDILLSREKPSKKTTDTTSDFSNVFNTRLDEMKEERKRHFDKLTKKERGKDE